MSNNYILVIDDDPGTHRLLDLILRPLLMDVKFASDGHQALDMITADLPGLLVLDLEMPRMNGFELLARLSQSEKAADIPVIVFSANVYAAQRQGYEWPSQVVEALEKTGIRPAQLRELVQEQLSPAT
jgi:CheY-like chemotaxis protein